VDRLLGEHGIPRDSEAGRDEFEKRMELRRRSDDGIDFAQYPSQAFVRDGCKTATPVLRVKRQIFGELRTAPTEEIGSMQ